METDDCACLLPRRFGGTATFLGEDTTKGRYGAVSLRRCKHCDRIWLDYFVEYEGFSRSDRWYRAVVSPEDAARVKPTTAVALIAAQPWHIYGGSYFEHAGKRGAGLVLVDL